MATPQLTPVLETVVPHQVAQITASTPVILNDLNDCLLESKNIVVSKKDNKYILFTTAVPEPTITTLQPAPQIQSITLQPLVSATPLTAPTAATATITTATVIDTGRIEELLKRDKIIKKTELQSDGTTTTTYIFDECDILPLKTASKNTTPIVQQTAATPAKPATLSIVKVAPDNVVPTGATATVIPAVAQPNVAAFGGGSALISASTPSQIISTKKLLKPTHPRIKYSKHKNPSVQSVTTTLPILSIPTVPSSNSGQSSLSLPVQEAPVGTTTKIELLNFSLSRKFPGQNTKTIDVSNIQQIPISAVAKPIATTRYTVSDYETITSNTSQSNDFTTGMIDDLDYSVIDDIELPDDVQVNFAESYSSKEPHDNAEEDDEDTEDSQQAPKPLPGKKLAKSQDAKILNASMDDKYALLANTSIMKNFEYTVNESVVSDGDDGEMRQYICRHCGKRYRWKSTLRRHENVECGGKEAMHQCPYCTYKAKQRGNLGVHIRKHHSDMPQLESRRKSKNRDSLNLIESIKAEAEGQL